MDVGSKGKRVNVNECYGDEPKESESVKLKVRKECEAQHFEESLVLRLSLFMEETTGEGRFVFE